jgi:tRNA-specific 2-thiouridylase
MSRVLVAMSGGVDSSVAAALLVEDGHDVTGVTMKLWGGASDTGCCSVSDVEDARRVAAQLGIPHYVFAFSDDFDRHVVEPYVDAYAAGRTPNPCVECNRHLKWGRLLTRALQLGYDHVATGHHARIDCRQGRVELRRGADAAKDQSYVLAVLGARELSRTLLPIGDLTKAEVRAHAERRGLRTATKPDSMDVCFITRGGRGAFLDERVQVAPGPVVALDGTRLGEHAGVSAFTIGQRRGVGVATGDRAYVVDIDAPTATVTLGRREDLLRDAIPVTAPTAVNDAPSPSDELLVQCSAHGAVTPGRLDGDRVLLHTPRPRVAPGQLVALYDARDADRVVGSAVAA